MRKKEHLAAPSQINHFWLFLILVTVGKNDIKHISCDAICSTMKAKKKSTVHSYGRRRRQNILFSIFLFVNNNQIENIAPQTYHKQASTARTSYHAVPYLFFLMLI